MVAQWNFNDLSTDGVTTESVAGNNLTVKHFSNTGFTASEAELTFSLDENTVTGTVVGQRLRGRRRKRCVDRIAASG